MKRKGLYKVLAFIMAAAMMIGCFSLSTAETPSGGPDKYEVKLNLEEGVSIGTEGVVVKLYETDAQNNKNEVGSTTINKDTKDLTAIINYTKKEGCKYKAEVDTIAGKKEAYSADCSPYWVSKTEESNGKETELNNKYEGHGLFGDQKDYEETFTYDDTTVFAIYDSVTLGNDEWFVWTPKKLEKEVQNRISSNLQTKHEATVNFLYGEDNKPISGSSGWGSYSFTPDKETKKVKIYASWHIDALYEVKTVDYPSQTLTISKREELNVEKLWENANSDAMKKNDSNLPDSIELELYRNGIATGQTVTVKKNAQASDTKDAKWTTKFYINKDGANYTVKETKVNGKPASQSVFLYTTQAEHVEDKVETTITFDWETSDYNHIQNGYGRVADDNAFRITKFKDGKTYYGMVGNNVKENERKFLVWSTKEITNKDDFIKKINENEKINGLTKDNCEFVYGGTTGKSLEPFYFRTANQSYNSQRAIFFKYDRTDNKMWFSYYNNYNSLFEYLYNGTYVSSSQTTTTQGSNKITITNIFNNNATVKGTKTFDMDGTGVSVPLNTKKDNDNETVVLGPKVKLAVTKRNANDHSTIATLIEGTDYEVTWSQDEKNPNVWHYLISGSGIVVQKDNSTPCEYLVQETDAAGNVIANNGTLSITGDSGEGFDYKVTYDGNNITNTIDKSTVYGNLKITKHIDGYMAENGKAAFTFIIQNNDVMGATYYKTIVIPDGKTEKEETLRLPIGNYKITELNTLKYSIKTGNLISIDSAKVEYGKTKTASFTNVLSSENKFSHSDFVVNHFTINKDGSISTSTN